MRETDFRDAYEALLERMPDPPSFEWIRARALATKPRRFAGWQVAVVAAVAVLVGFGGVALLTGGLGGIAEGPPGDSESQVGAGDVTDSIAGRWILESWEENSERIVVEVGVNTVDEPWIEFTQTFEGVRESFVSADGTGTAGTFVGSTGCNGISPTGYEYSAGFLVLDEAVVERVGCDPDRAEQVLLAMLWNTSDGIEVVMDGDRMEWFGSNLEGIVYPLVFRRSGSPPPDADGSSTTAPSTDESPVIQVYNVDGVEVVTPTLLGELPERATHVEFTTPVIDSGGGPELCIIGVADSLPPQCSGPVAAGLDMDSWSEELNDVRWGDRSVVVTWPPVNGVVEVLEHSEVVTWEAEYPPGELPAECRDAETAAGAGPINEYARSLGDRNGGIYLANDGTLVLQVVDDPAPHREALAEFGGACVVQVPRSEARQRSIQDAIVPLLADIPELAGIYAVSTGAGGRVDVQVPVADQATAQAIANLVDDPTAIRIVGTGILRP
ncbi:MAG: hypothetical protein ACRDVL_01665 [Acidimicrobiia bacterium]